MVSALVTWLARTLSLRESDQEVEKKSSSRTAVAVPSPATRELFLVRFRRSRDSNSPLSTSGHGC